MSNKLHIKQGYKKIDWLSFLQSFLNLAELGCKEIEASKHFQSIGGLKIEYGKTLNVAIIYNMKHAIEIFLKTLIRIIDDNSDQNLKGENGHDLDYLFALLKEKIKQDTLQGKFKKLDASEEILLPYIEQEIENLEKNTLKIKKIIDYYFKLEFLDKNKITIIDSKNTAFKYPENTMQINAQIDYLDFCYAQELDTNKIKADIQVLRKNLNAFKVIFGRYHPYK